MKTVEDTRQQRPAGSGWADAPRLGPADLIAMIWNERATVIIVGAVIGAIGLALALLAPKTYIARAELLVRMGQEYVYQPEGGAPSVPADMQEVINAEMRMLGSGAVARRALDRVGVGTVFPEIATGAGSDAAKLAAAERALAENLTIETAPQTPAIALSFSHKDPRVAAEMLNTLVDAYLERRREVLVGGEYDALAEQGAAMDARVSEANALLSDFLSAHEISDFEAETAALAARAADIETQLLDARARIGEAEARRAALRASYDAQPEEIELYSESDARRQLVEAQMEREELLSRYQEDALPLREVERRISQLQAFLAGGDPPSVTRRGPNPVRQDIAGQLFATDAESRAQRGREAALTQQREEVRARLRTLQDLAPDYRRLVRERTIYEQSAGAFAARAEEARSFSQLLGGSSDNISLVERATPPSQGKSLRMPIALVTIMLAGLLGVAAGLVRGLMRQNFPTPSSAARTLGAPVLAVVPAKADKRAARGKAAPPREPPSLKLVKSKA